MVFAGSLRLGLEASMHQDGTDAESGRSRKDFFISYTGSDEDFAQWIAWQLEKFGYTTILQAWDFAAGSHFVHEMHEAAQAADQTIAVLSRTYLQSNYAAAEWQEAWRRDPTGAGRRLIAVRIEDCERPGLLGQLVTVDLFDVDASTASARLRAAITKARAKPLREPSFPSRRSRGFPGGWPRTTNLPRRNPHFAGRERELDRLDELLSGDRPASVVTICGMGGAGKTQLAIEYAHRSSSRYDTVWWISAQQPVIAVNNLANLAERFDLRPDNSRNVTVLELLWEQLRTSDRWLLIFDNAESPAGLRDYLPHGPGHVLVTSQLREWGQLSRVVELGVFSRQESIELFRSHIRDCDSGLAAEIAEELGDLPMFVAQASSYVATRRLPLDTYLRLLRSYGDQVLAKGEAMDYQHGIDTVWSMFIERLETEQPVAVRVLELCAALAPDAVPLSLFTAHPEVLTEPLRSAVSDDVQFTEAVGELARCSLATRSDDVIQVHRMLQAAILRRLDESGRARTTATAVDLLAAADPGDPEDHRHWLSYAQLLPHALKLQHEVGTDDFRRLLVNIGGYTLARGQLLAANEFLIELIALWTSSLGEDAPDVLAALNRLAATLRALGQYRSALTIDQDVLARLRGAADARDPRVQQVAETTANALDDVGHYQESMEAHRVQYEERMAAYGPDDLMTLKAASGLGHALVSCGYFTEAVRLLEDTLRRRSQYLGPQHQGTIFTSTGLAAALANSGREQRALELDTEAVELRRRVLGGHHPHTWIAQHCAASDLWLLGRMEEALALFEETLRERRSALGSRHPETLQSATSAATVYSAMGDPEAALAEHRRVLREYEQALGAEHPTTLQCSNDLAVDLQETGAAGEAVALHEQTLARRTALLGPAHPDTVQSLNNLAACCADQGDAETAASLFREALRACDARLGSEHPDAILISDSLDLVSQGNWRRNQGRHARLLTRANHRY
ncbi:tetratricopeptide repeat protein [Lentzea alba]|uniref:FxSxx-COOH system tetratricopeptide repeat protein n=1 Tax=Lentzea alba TaxID=2714351 RepID=UPI0039BFE7CF